MNPILLTGMHRSGTSAIARLTRTLGCDLGSNLLPATENNRHGHFEEMAFIHFHDRLIERHFAERAPFCEWLPLADADVAFSAAEIEEARAIWAAHRARGGTGWKDPRTSLFLDLWAEVLPEARIIVCLRHPYQVHLSLLRRGEPFLHVDYSAGIRGWTIYNERIARSLARLPRERFAVVDADESFREPQALAERLAGFLGLPPADTSAAAITPGEFHFEESVHSALATFGDYFPATTRAFDALKQYDLLHPAAFVDKPAAGPMPIRSAEARLIEFEEVSGLRPRAKKMLIRSIAADRKRSSEFKRLSAEAEMQKDRLIEDLSRFNEQLKQEVLRQRTAKA